MLILRSSDVGHSRVENRASKVGVSAPEKLSHIAILGGTRSVAVEQTIDEGETFLLSHLTARIEQPVNYSSIADSDHTGANAEILDSCEENHKLSNVGGFSVSYFIQSNERSRHISSMIHALFRIGENGKLQWVATLESTVQAERLMETLDWQSPGEYVIRHFLVDCADRSSPPPTVC